MLYVIAIAKFRNANIEGRHSIYNIERKRGLDSYL